MLKRTVCCLLSVLLALAPLLPALAEIDLAGDDSLILDEMLEEVAQTPAPSPLAVPQELTPRDEFINRIIALGEHLYTKANGKAQRAHYKTDIYVCKNFTTYVFNQNKGDFRMAEYPSVKLTIPNNLPEEKCRPYCYGYAWQEVSAAKGNPFVIAARFLYDTSKTEEENMAEALDFLRQVKRGDFFQMTASYSAGTGAHSAIMTEDFDPETGKLIWMDSNMRGTRRDGIRYGYVQFNAEAPIEWWAEAFCQKKRGATIYRLREDIVYRNDVQ